MGGSLSNLNRVDRQIDDVVTARPPPKRSSFGDLELEFELDTAGAMMGSGGDLPLVTGVTGETAPPPSSGATAKKKSPGVRKPSRPSIQTRATRQGMEAVTRLAEEETRIARNGNGNANGGAAPSSARAGVIDQSRRKTMALDEETAAALIEIGDTTNNASRSAAVASFGSLNSLDSLDAPDSFGDWDDEPASKKSGVASSNDRIAAVRDLYAQGKTEAALAVASEVVHDLTASEPEPFDDTGADPYGGLILIEDGYDGFGGLEAVYDDAIDQTAIVDAADPGSPRANENERLRRMTSRRVPRLLVTAKEISKLPMDPRAAFLLGNIDGVQSMEEILDICAMPEAEALELIEWLQRMGVIAID